MYQVALTRENFMSFQMSRKYWNLSPSISSKRVTTRVMSTLTSLSTPANTGWDLEKTAVDEDKSSSPATDGVGAAPGGDDILYVLYLNLWGLCWALSRLRKDKSQSLS